MYIKNIHLQRLLRSIYFRWNGPNYFCVWANCILFDSKKFIKFIKDLITTFKKYPRVFKNIYESISLKKLLQIYIFQVEWPQLLLCVSQFHFSRSNSTNNSSATGSLSIDIFVHKSSTIWRCSLSKKQDHLRMNTAPDQTIILGLKIFLDLRSLSSKSWLIFLLSIRFCRCIR